MTKYNPTCLALAWALAPLLAGAQGLPAPPVSPPLVRAMEYDANGNLTRTIVAPDSAAAQQRTALGWDRLDRLTSVRDPGNGLLALGYNGREDVVRVTDPRSLVTEYPRNGLGDTTRLVSPDTGAATHTFDAAGNLRTRTDSRGARATYTYDALNRMTRVVYSQTGQTSLTYSWNYDQTGGSFTNGIGRLTSTSSPVSSTQYAYDSDGRVVTATQRFNAQAGANAAQVSRSVGYGYDADGNVVSVTYPSGRRLALSYAEGRLASMALGRNATAAALPLIGAIQWEPFGGVGGWQWHAGATTRAHERVHDGDGRLVRYPLGAWVRDLTYDEADRITSYVHYAAATGAAQPQLDQRFSYDALNRLTGVVTSSASWTLGYDANGNRTGVTLNGVSSTYSVATNSNRLTATTSPARNFVFDNAGNTLGDGTFTATYNLAGRLATLTKAGVTTTYAIDGYERRVRKFDSTGSASTVLFVYDQQGQLLGEYSHTGAPLREYVWLNDVPVAMFVPNPADAAADPLVFHIHTDHLNAPRVVLDGAGRVRWTWLAEPFGSTAPDSNPGGLGPITMNLRHPGQYADSESGLFYNHHRDYDPSVGRYTQSDPIGLAGGINTYAYVFNQPTRYTDPDGRFAPAVVAGGALAGGVVLIAVATNRDAWARRADEIARNVTARLAEEAEIGARIMCSISPWLPTCSGGGAIQASEGGSNNAPGYSQACKPAIPDVSPGDLCEQLALAEAKAGAGYPIMTGLEMKDAPRLVAHYGPGPWIKKQHTHSCQNGRKLTIHYFTNGRGLNVELKFVP